MQPIPPAQSSQRQMFAVAVALSLAFLTVILPTALAATGGTIALSLLAGAHALRKSDGLEPNIFSAGVYLAGLVLVAAAAWQGVLALRGLPAAAPTSPSPTPPEGRTLAKPQETTVVQDFLRRPWATLGLWLFLIDALLVRWRVKEPIHGLDLVVAAAVMASMIWATVFVMAACIRATRAMLRRLWQGARQSQFVAGMVTLGGLGLGVAGGLLLTILGVVAARQLEHVTFSSASHPAATSNAAIEQVRVTLLDVSEFRRDARPALVSAPPSPAVPVLADSSGRRTGWSTPASPSFARCVDQLMKRDSYSDPVKQAAQQLAWRFSLNEQDARGLVIDTLVSVCERKAGDTDSLAAYFARSLRNAALNFRRRFLRDGKQCSIEIVPVMEVEAEDGRPWDFTDPAAARQAFCKLEELDQALIKDRLFVGRNFAEIADLYDMSENGAQKAFDRAIQRLRKNFEKN